LQYAQLVPIKLTQKRNTKIMDLRFARDMSRVTVRVKVILNVSTRFIVVERRHGESISFWLCNCVCNEFWV